MEVKKIKSGTCMYFDVKYDYTMYHFDSSRIGNRVLIAQWHGTEKPFEVQHCKGDGRKPSYVEYVRERFATREEAELKLNEILSA